jgi:hypothetical protein
MGLAAGLQLWSEEFSHMLLWWQWLILNQFQKYLLQIKRNTLKQNANMAAAMTTTAVQWKFIYSLSQVLKTSIQLMEI